MEVSQETQIHSGDRAKATAEGHKEKSPKKKNGDLIATRPELGPKGDPVAKEILRSDRSKAQKEKRDLKKPEPKASRHWLDPKGDPVAKGTWEPIESENQGGSQWTILTPEIVYGV